MALIDEGELISHDQVRRRLERALKDPSKIVNLPPLRASKVEVGLVVIKKGSARKTNDKIKVQGKGFVEMRLLYKNAELGEIEVQEDLPITYSAEFTHRKALLGCKAVARLPREWGFVGAIPTSAL
jgi:hypothetical protein